MILERYVNRYIEHVSVTAPLSANREIREGIGGSHDIANEILVVGPIQLDDLGQGLMTTQPGNPSIHKLLF